MKRSRVRSLAQGLLATALGFALVCLGGWGLGTMQSSVLLPLCVLVIALVVQTALAYAVDEVLTVQAARFRDLELSLNAHRVEPAPLGIVPDAGRV